MSTVYVQKVEPKEIDENTQQLVWLDRKPEPFEESDLVVWPAITGQITDLDSARRIIPTCRYASGIEVTEVVFVI